MNGVQNPPQSTYRLQLGPNLGFDQAARLAPYLSELGVSHAYLSPCLMASSGSSHGYDVVDPRRASEELGGEAAFRRLCRELSGRGVGVVLDIVPHHLCIRTPRENPFFWDVLGRGPDSEYAELFDIDWEGERRGRVILPILGAPLDQVISEGHVRVEREEPGGGCVLWVYDRVLPLAEAADGLDAAAAAGNREALAALLERQHFSLQYWRPANARLNYRRFFDVDDLIALRTERKWVFDLTHEKVISWVREGLVQGLRVDHPDGLRDPRLYFEWLRAAVPDAWVVAEKILQPGEALPEDWPIAGTTGYEFLNLAMGIFVDQTSKSALDAVQRDFTGRADERPAEACRKAKRLAALELLESDVRRLSRDFGKLCEGDGFELDPAQAREVLVAALSELPVYRTYVRDDSGADARDGRILDGLEAGLREQLAPELGAAGRFLVELFRSPPRDSARADFRARFQQLSGPVMAKGVEDTVLYQSLRLTALNEVGAHPGRYGESLQSFHESCRVAARERPSSMLATSTHDTKRSGDARLRLAVLSEVPDQWRSAVSEFRAHAERYRQGDLPDAGTEYFIYQTLVASWPIGVERLEGYLIKALREAKRHTSWLEPNAEFEEATKQFARAALADSRFAQLLSRFADLVGPAAQAHSLALALVAACAPGVVDVYQGTEVFDLSLADPDNRRPVDFDWRRATLARLRAEGPSGQRFADADESKLWVTHVALATRLAHPDWFGPGASYLEIPVEGPEAHRVIAFSRADQIVAVATRFHARHFGRAVAARLTLPGGRYVDRLSGLELEGGSVDAGSLLGRRPVALLERQGSS